MPVRPLLCTFATCALVPAQHGFHDAISTASPASPTPRLPGTLAGAGTPAFGELRTRERSARSNTTDGTAWTVSDFGLHLLWQNDSWLADSDRFFTNGAELGCTIAADLRTLSWLPLRGTPTLAAHQFAIGQDMFTPEDFEAPTPDPLDRPYAGWLHISYRHQALTLVDDGRDFADRWEIELGVVGPSSLADDTQRQVHEMVDAPEPRGWSSQLHDEPGFVIGYARNYRTWFEPAVLGPLQADLLGESGVRLGNVDTSIRLGSTLRFGLELPRHLGTAARTVAAPPHRFYLHGGVLGRCVLRNIFLDGNSWRNSADVDRNLFVADFVVGLTWELPNNLRISVTETFRTPEFDSPSSQADPSNFTSVFCECYF
jgi:lipid A 3-O-deacylase